MANSNKYYTGSGRVLVSKVDPLSGLPDASGFLDLGNVSMASLTTSVTNVTHMEAQTGKDLQDFQIAKQPKTGLGLKMNEYSIENFALAFYSAKITNSGATVTDEIVTVPTLLANSCNLNNFNITSFASLKNSAGTTTYALGADYNWDVFGNLSFPLGSAITAGQSLKAAYTASPSSSFGAYTQSQSRLWVRLQGLNNARSNSPVLLEFPNVAFDPAKTWEVIATGKTSVEELDITGQVLYTSGFDLAPYGNSRIPGGFFKETQL